MHAESCSNYSCAKNVHLYPIYAAAYLTLAFVPSNGDLVGLGVVLFVFRCCSWLLQALLSGFTATELELDLSIN